MKIGLRISHLLALQSAIGLLVAMALVSVSFWFVRTTQDTVDQVYAAKDVTADILPPPMYLIEMRLVLSQVLDGTLPPDRAAAEIERLAGEYRARVQHWQAHPPYGLERSLLGHQHTAGQRFIEQAQAFAAAAASADQAALREALQAAHRAYQAHRTGVDETVKAAGAFAQAASAAADRNASVVTSTQIAMLALALGLLSLAGWWVRGRLASPIRQAVRVAERIAGGDLSQPVPVQGSGETAELMGALQTMQESLDRMVVQVRQSTEHIHTAADEIAKGNHDLSMRTEQAASSLQETAASMEQINGSVRSTAEAARQASQMVQQAADVAAQGGEVVGQAVHTMQSIHHSSQKIQDIIGVIDGIAFQTNILALNAAVEAARAGEQGRGFAVVAGEVRGLAQRSATAAKEIKGLIGDSVGTVENGSRHVSAAGDTMESVVGSVRQVTNIITHISAAAKEQSDGIDQVNLAVNHLDQVTQQNAALVEQSAAAADSLRQQAHQLAETVRRFQLSGISPAG